MSAAAALLDRLGRPGDVRLGTVRAEGPARLATGLVRLDALVGGGLPRGRLTELTGPRSAGRTGLACAVAAAATRAGEVVGWIDPHDALDPEAAAAAGVVLARTLWARPPSPDDALRAAEWVAGAGGFGLVVVDLADHAAPGLRTGDAAWPRLQRAAERTRTAVLVVGTRPCAGAAAALGLALDVPRARWSGGCGRLLLLDGVRARITVVRSRLGGVGRAAVVEQAVA
jgi:RecA/RadA recombinase